MDSRHVRRARSYTVEEAAAILAVNAETVRRWIRDGEIEATMTRMGTGGGYRISHAEIERQVRTRYPYLELDLPE